MTLLEFYTGKRVFISGHTGFKGSWLSHILVQAGAEVTGFALEAPTVPSLFELSNIKGKIHSITGDVRNLTQVIQEMKKAKPDIVFHMAAQPLVRLSYEKPVMTYETNVMGTVNILEAVRSCPSIRSVVNVTTDKVYENKEWHWGYRENENLCGFDPYSNSKSCSELVTHSYINSFFNTYDSPAVSTARSGNVIGGGDFAADRIIPDCIRSAGKNETIIIRNPHAIRPYQHVLECLGGYLLLAKMQWEDKAMSGSYNFGPDDSSCITTGELVKLFCSKWNGIQWEIQGDSGPHEASFLKLDCAKAKHALKWQPHWNIETAVEKTIEWVKTEENTHNADDILQKQIKDYFNAYT